MKPLKMTTGEKMAEIRDGTVELHVKVNGTHYALGMKLSDFPKENDFNRGMETITNCLRTTLITQGYLLG